MIYLYCLLIILLLVFLPIIVSNSHYDDDIGNISKESYGLTFMEYHENRIKIDKKYEQKVLNLILGEEI